MRKHGFERPWHTLQIISWFLFPSIVLAFSFLAGPFLPSPWNIILVTVHTLATAIIVPTAYICTTTDPSDPGLLAKKDVNMFEGSNGRDEELADKNYCTTCECPVNKMSKHCRACDKCVDVFDHHCKWLNNCVGKATYKPFLWMIFSVFFLSVTEVVGFSMVVSHYFDEKEVVLKEVEKFYGRESTQDHEAFASFWLFFLFLSFIVSLLITQLSAFHIMLVTKKMTTYEFIIANRQKKAEKLAAQEGSVKRKSRTKVSAVHAYREPSSRVTTPAMCPKSPVLCPAWGPLDNSRSYRKGVSAHNGTTLFEVESDGELSRQNSGGSSTHGKGGATRSSWFGLGRKKYSSERAMSESSDPGRVHSDSELSLSLPMGIQKPSVRSPQIATIALEVPQSPLPPVLPTGGFSGSPHTASPKFFDRGNRRRMGSVRELSQSQDDPGRPLASWGGE
eukprot:GFYU01004729.1.p1 GENE.GFYU01004729.1~~GFYU01004729.1.p1  ORF type:complete len:465 (+),score=90.72 GFYU01004729.1:54-1397(+)